MALLFSLVALPALSLADHFPDMMGFTKGLNMKISEQKSIAEMRLTLTLTLTQSLASVLYTSAGRKSRALIGPHDVNKHGGVILYWFFLRWWIFGE